MDDLQRIAQKSFEFVMLMLYFHGDLSGSLPDSV